VLQEQTLWEGQPLLLTWLPGYHPSSTERVTQVSGLCFTEGGLIVLVSEDAGGWNLPGGKPEPGETWEQTLGREVAEEACADILRVEFMGAQRVEGLTAEPYYQLRSWARVRLNPFLPQFEMRHRTTVSARDYTHILSWGAGSIAQALLTQALALEQQDGEG